MKKILSMGFLALAVAAAVPAWAEEAEVEDGVVGWTPIAIGLASPVQLPWGMARWDVFGLDLNILYSDAPKMYGIGLGGIAMRSRDTLGGLQLSALCNWNDADVYGIRVTPGANISFGTTYGLEASSFAYRSGEFWGVDCNFIGAYGNTMYGWEIAGIVNLASEKSYGWALAIGGNMAAKAYGLQMAAVFNFTDELHGCQIGIVNFARECPWGFQIGLVNIIMDNRLKVLPIVNCYF